MSRYFIKRSIDFKREAKNYWKIFNFLKKLLGLYFRVVDESENLESFVLRETRV